ncbi:MAG: cysteine desulfurase [Cytophagaceae bacterium]|nr:cysteine desulfurase [Gemmatimonadaceae bacterium]
MTSPSSAIAPLDTARIRADFPILGTLARGKPLVYLDNAGSSQKPRQVIEAITRYYESENANIHRGVHYLSERASELYEGTREGARRFFNARRAHEIIFTRGTTEGMNLVGAGFAQAILKPGDEVIVSTMDHHSVIVPWQQACIRSGAKIVAVPVTPEGELDIEAYVRLLNERTKMVALTWVSNALGTINPVRRIIEEAHARGAAVMLDGAQAAPHLAVDVQAVDCDFFVCSGHKMLGPTGVGVLYGKETWLDRLPPYQTGGGMIDMVTIEQSTWARLPAKFEAGTPDIAAVVGFQAALDYLEAVGLDAVAAHEHELVSYATERVAEVPGLRVIGTTPNKAGVLSLVMEGAHPHDIGTILDQEGVAVRAGHHCCQPLMRHYGLSSTARASFYLYNTREEVDVLVGALHKVREIFS